MIRFVISAPTDTDAFGIASDQLARFFKTTVTKVRTLDPWDIRSICSLMDNAVVWDEMATSYQLDDRTLILVPLKLKPGREKRWLAAVNKE